MRSLALVRDILRPAPCEQELQEAALPRPLVTKLPAPACVTWTLAPVTPARSIAQMVEQGQMHLSQAASMLTLQHSIKANV